MSSAPKSFQERDEWMWALLASDLPHAAVRVGMAIARHLRCNTGRCDPSCAALATDSHVSERWVYQAVALLEHAGWIVIERTRGQLSQYVLLTPDDRVTPDVNVTPDSYVRGTTDTHFRGTPEASAGVTAPDIITKRAIKRTIKGAKSLSHAPNLNLGNLGNGKDSDAKDLLGETEAKPQPKNKKDNGHADVDAWFEKFWPVYPKQVGEDAARRAFAKLIKGGADPEAVIARAKLYAIERQNKPDKYTLNPATWLNDGHWKNAPPPGVVIDNDSGDPVAIEPPPAPRRNGRKTWAELGEELKAQWRAEEAANGKRH
jgi:hypothetical protein